MALTSIFYNSVRNNRVINDITQVPNYNYKTLCKQGVLLSSPIALGMPLLPAAGNVYQLSLVNGAHTRRESSMFHVPRISYLRRRLFAICIAACVLLVITAVSRLRPFELIALPASYDSPLSVNALPYNQVLTTEHLKSENYLLGPPTLHIRDNLRNDTRYLTSWLSAGWTNDVITLGNLIYLAVITERVPILPPFTSHIGGPSIPIPFSDIFDLPRLSHAINIPILEWHRVKNIAAAESAHVRDELGCWNIWEVVNAFADGPRGSYTTLYLNVDVSYTRAPAWVKLIPGFEHDSHSTFWTLARLAFPAARDAALADRAASPTYPSPHSGAVLPPDEQLMCYDYLYYVCGTQPSEYEYDYSPAWRFVMMHMHFTPELAELGRTYLRRTLGLPETSAIPPYITVHARRGDIGDWCGAVPRAECLPPLSAFARRVREVQEELAARGVRAAYVVMTSDEQDGEWWAGVAALGWRRIDHVGMRTAEVHGRWYPVILDAVVQAGGMGFVGTDRSTFSALARRRVLDWNGGIARTVLWGRLGADDASASS